MLEKKNRRRKTDLPQTHRISLKKIKHKSLIPINFSHDVVAEVAIRNILLELSNHIVEEIEE